LLSAALATVAVAAEPKRVVLDVPSMNCSLCPISVKKALEKVPGVVEVRAELATKSAEATYDPDRTSPEALARAVANAGYPASIRKP
jgi:mercuric ion binding protein